MGRSRTRRVIASIAELAELAPPGAQISRGQDALVWTDAERDRVAARGREIRRDHPALALRELYRRAMEDVLEPPRRRHNVGKIPFKQLRWFAEAVGLAVPRKVGRKTPVHWNGREREAMVAAAYELRRGDPTMGTKATLGKAMEALQPDRRRNLATVSRAAMEWLEEGLRAYAPPGPAAAPAAAPVPDDTIEVEVESGTPAGAGAADPLEAMGAEDLGLLLVGRLATEKAQQTATLEGLRRAIADQEGRIARIEASAASSRQLLLRVLRALDPALVGDQAEAAAPDAPAPAPAAGDRPGPRQARAPKVAVVGLRHHQCDAAREALGDAVRLEVFPESHHVRGRSWGGFDHVVLSRFGNHDVEISAIRQLGAGRVTFLRQTGNDSLIRTLRQLVAP
jgi:hypothetical protein